jgi:hypothetical protein
MWELGRYSSLADSDHGVFSFYVGTHTGNRLKNGVQSPYGCNRTNSSPDTLKPWKWKQNIPSKRLYLSAILCSVTIRILKPLAEDVSEFHIEMDECMLYALCMIHGIWRRVVWYRYQHLRGIFSTMFTSTQRLETECSFQNSVCYIPVYQTTRRHTPEDRTVHNSLGGNCKFRFTLQFLNVAVNKSGSDFVKMLTPQIQRSRVRFPALSDFQRSSGSGTGPTHPLEYNWGATLKT